MPSDPDPGPGTAGLVLEGFQDGDDHPRHRAGGAVQRVGELEVPLEGFRARTGPKDAGEFCFCTLCTVPLCTVRFRCFLFAALDVHCSCEFMCHDVTHQSTNFHCMCLRCVFCLCHHMVVGPG